MSISETRQQSGVTNGSGTSDLYGVYTATVVDNDDPEGLARVKVEFPWREDISNWARIATPLAGTGMGAHLIPNVGTEVLVSFEAGDIHHPYVLGGLWNEEDRPPEPEYHGLGRSADQTQDGVDEDSDLGTGDTGDVTETSDTDPGIGGDDVDGGERADTESGNSGAPGNDVSGTEQAEERLNAYQSRKFESESGHKLVFDDQFDGIKLETAGGNALVLSDKYGGILLQDENDSHIAMTGDGIDHPGADPAAEIRGENPTTGDVNPILPFYPESGGISIDAGQEQRVSIEALDVVAFGWKSSSIMGMHSANVLQGPNPATYLTHLIPLGGIGVHALTQVGISATSPLGGLFQFPGQIGIEAPLVSVSAWAKYKRMSGKDTVTSAIKKRTHGFQRDTVQVHNSTIAAKWDSGVIRDMKHKMWKIGTALHDEKAAKKMEAWAAKKATGGLEGATGVGMNLE